MTHGQKQYYLRVLNIDDASLQTQGQIRVTSADTKGVDSLGKWKGSKQLLIVGSTVRVEQAIASGEVSQGFAESAVFMLLEKME